MHLALILPFLAALLASANSEATHGLKDNGKVVDLKSGQPIDWYTCEARGNYPDPTTCDHYIACTDALHAYQMPCQMGQAGRLWYVRNSGPSEQTSYCNYPEQVDCPLADLSTIAPPPTTPEEIKTTEQPEPQTTPDDVTEETAASPKTTTTTTTTTTTPKPSGECKDKEEGAACEVDCDQCHWCELNEDGKPVSHFFRCHLTPITNPFDDISGTYVKERCADGYLVSNNTLGSGLHGGQCTLWDDLDDGEKTWYLENCSEKPCEYGQDEEDVCTANYWRDLHQGAGPERQTCVSGIWNPAHENCSACSDAPACAGKGDCQ